MHKRKLIYAVINKHKLMPPENILEEFSVDDKYLDARTKLRNWAKKNLSFETDKNKLIGLKEIVYIVDKLP